MDLCQRGVNGTDKKSRPARGGSGWKKKRVGRNQAEAMAGDGLDLPRLVFASSIES